MFADGTISGIIDIKRLYFSIPIQGTAENGGQGYRMTQFAGIQSTEGGDKTFTCNN